MMKWVIEKILLEGSSRSLVHWLSLEIQRDAHFSIQQTKSRLHVVMHKRVYDMQLLGISSKMQPTPSTPWKSNYIKIMSVKTTEVLIYF